MAAFWTVSTRYSPVISPAASRSIFLRSGVPLLVGAAAVVPFLSALSGGFNWDDIPNLVENPRYRGLDWTHLKWMFTTMLLGHYIPLTWLSFGFDYAVGGMNPRGYHLTNVLLHGVNAALVYLVARRLLRAASGGAGSPRRDEERRREQLATGVGAAFAALVFGVHPLRVESVAWVTERRDVLCGLFFLLTVLAYLRGVSRGGTIQARWWAVSVAAFVLALLSKAAAMPLPAALLLLDIYPLGRVAAMGWRRLVTEKIPYLVPAGFSGLMAVVAQARAGAVTEYPDHGIAARVAMTSYSFMFYPWKLVWPNELSPLYELPARLDPFTARFLLPMIGLVIVTAALALLRRRCPGALTAWVYSALMVLPVSGAVVHAGIQLVADRYSYLSGLGFAVLAGGGLAWLLRARDRLRPSVVGVGVLVALLVVVGWGASSWRQGQVWRDSETLWRWALELDSNCAVCSTNLAKVLLEPTSPGTAQLREAEALLRHSIELSPRRPSSYRALGVALAQQRRYDEAEAAFLEFIRREPGSATGKADLGVLRVRQHRYVEAIALLRGALVLSPELREPRAALARALQLRAAELRGEGKGDVAETLAREAEGILASPAAPSGRPSTASGP